MTFPPDAKLTLDLERFVLGSGYWLHTRVLPAPDTDPVELEPSLLVRLNTMTQPDAIARVCTRADLEGYLEVSPPMYRDLYELTGPSIQAAVFAGEIAVGDGVMILCPDIWKHINPLATTFLTTVYALTPWTNTIIVSNRFPCAYTLGMHYSTSGILSHSGLDAVAQRYNPTYDMYCRVREDYTRFDDLSAAINKLESIRAEAQGLVKDYERSGSSFEGDTTETFT